MNTFPFLSIYFFSHFSPWGKMGKKVYGKCIFPHGEKWENTHFSIGKNGVGPPPPKLFTQYQFGVYFTVYRIINIMNIVKIKLAKNDITIRGHP